MEIISSSEDEIVTLDFLDTFKMNNKIQKK